MSVDFSRIKKYSKASNNFDEKLEYLNKELKKTGLCEVANSTGGMYSVTKQEPNPSHVAFTGLSINGQPLGFAGGNYTINAPLINGAIYSPPHPVTGERRAAGTWKGILIGFKAPVFPGQPIGSGSDRVPHGIMWVWNPDIPPLGRWVSLESNGTQWCVWVDNAFGSMSMVPYGSASSNLPSSLKNSLDSININNYTNPEQFGPPTNPILFQNSLGDANHLPINLNNLSPQGFDYLKGKATASSGVNYDLYNYLDKRFGIEASNWYENNPTLPHESNPYIPPPEAPYVPLANKKNDVKIAAEYKKIKKKYTGANDPFWDAFSDSIPGGTKNFPGKDPDDPFKFSQGHQTSSYNPEGDLLSEAVKLGYFEPEVLNVNIDDLRKGIVPEFPKNPPPEMIDGYAANSRLAPKKIKGSPFIKITKKDLAKNHLLTDKQISDFMNDIKMINDYIKKNPSDLIYAQQRYPKHDPRLAQLNWQMDQMLEAGEEYVDKQFPENQKLFNQIKKKIKNTIDQTDPKKFKSTKLPKFDKTSLEDFKRKKEVYSRFMKKPINIKKLFKNKKRG